MEADLILVKDFPEADPEARMKVHMVYKDAITGKMSKRVRKRAPSRLTLWTAGLHPTRETARRWEQHGMELKIPQVTYCLARAAPSIIKQIIHL